MDTAHYMRSAWIEKRQFCRQEGKRPVSLHPGDKPRFVGVLRAKLALFGFHGPSPCHWRAAVSLSTGSWPRGGAALDAAHLLCRTAMKNITVKIDDETYQNARIRAAERGTSVSAMVREFLQALPEESEDERQRRIVATLEEIYAEADARATPRTKPLVPLTREEIHEERLR